MADTLMDIPWSQLTYWGREREYVQAAFESTWLSGGEFVGRFEALLSQRLDLPHVLAVANGTAALQLAFLGLDLQPGDEVIVPAFGFMAAANVLRQMHAIPVFADVDPLHWCLDAADVQTRVTPRTRAIVAIHNYGVVAAMGELRMVADAHSLILIEDCAESIFSRFDGALCGRFGDVSTFSFHATKTIATGEGGMVACKSPELHERLSLIRSHGLRRTRRHYWHEEYGNNFRLSNLLAAVGAGQLEQADRIVQAKREVMAFYRDRLGSINDLRFQQAPEGSEPVFWACALALAPRVAPARDELIAHLGRRGIECRPGFYSADQLDIHRDPQRPPTRVANALATAIIVLPSFPALSLEQLDRICDEISNARAFRVIPN